MVKAQGWFALLWVPLGFVIGRFVTAQIALPILLGLPRAIHLVSSGEMRAAVYRRLLFPPVLWIVLLSVILFLVRFFWPSAAAWFETNGALSGGVGLAWWVSCCQRSRRSLVQISRQTLTNLIGSFTSIATRIATGLTDAGEAQLFVPRRGVLC